MPLALDLDMNFKKNVLHTQHFCVKSVLYGEHICAKSVLYAEQMMVLHDIFCSKSINFENNCSLSCTCAFFVVPLRRLSPNVKIIRRKQL